MLGHQLYKQLSSKYCVKVTIRNGFESVDRYSLFRRLDVIEHIDISNFQNVVKAFAVAKPDFVINCVGIIKQLQSAKDPITSISVNSLFPHLLAQLCEAAGIRMIHVSTDCVFSGAKGNYSENDPSDAEDLYGKSKYLGEIADKVHVCTLRTSIIGHELGRSVALLEWFLNQKDTVSGYNKVIFSGLPTVEIANIIGDIILPDDTLYGLFNISSEPIAKYDLLNIIKNVYRKNIRINMDNTIFCDRSLDSTKFQTRTGYRPPDWNILIQTMYKKSME